MMPLALCQIDLQFLGERSKKRHVDSILIAYLGMIQTPRFSLRLTVMEIKTHGQNPIVMTFAKSLEHNQVSEENYGSLSLLWSSWDAIQDF
jgi:hypothetical protein